MAKVRVENFTVSVDGFGAGVGQRLDAPFGDGVDGLHDWMFAAFEDKAAGKGGLDVEQVGAARGGHRRDHHGPQHVRADPRAVGGRVVDGLVG